jgi:hypothetical protein
MSEFNEKYNVMESRKKLLAEVRRTINFMGIIINEGDQLEVWQNLREPPEVLTFIGFHPYIFMWCFMDNNKDYIFIPQKHIKRIKVFTNIKEISKGDEGGQDNSESKQ